MKKLLKENIWKHVSVVVLILFSLPFINDAIKTLDNNSLGNFLITISMLLVSVCFANFAFTYKDSDVEREGVKALSHGATGLFLFLTGTLLATMSVGIRLVYPPLNILICVFSLLLYMGFVLYDFWDLLRKR